MKYSSTIFAAACRWLTLRSINGDTGMLRNGDSKERNHHEDRVAHVEKEEHHAIQGDKRLRKDGTQEQRKLTDTFEGTVENLCDYIADDGSFNPLPVNVVDTEPDVLYSFERGAGTEFTFTFCDLNSGSSFGPFITIWDEIGVGDDSCSDSTDTSPSDCPDNLGIQVKFTPRDDRMYFVRNGEFGFGSYSGQLSWSSTSTDFCRPPGTT